MKWTLEDDWLRNILKDFKKTLPAGKLSSARLLELDSLVADTMKFIKASYPDRASCRDMSNAEGLKGRLEKIGNAISEIGPRAEARLIFSFEKN